MRAIRAAIGGPMVCPSRKRCQRGRAGDERVMDSGTAWRHAGPTAMTVLVTGGSGHLGANLVRNLLDGGEAVRVLERPDSNNTALAGLAVERASGDVRDYPTTLAAVRGCRRVYHCAAKVSSGQ